ncbi:MAG: aspartyl-tRNA(Asn)/glutamyl-tRNA(Gln) amidotransferase subunit [Actinomycetota bacterium]|nr:aspartyl-tRNA(Asn)/glutamyl-tRNA(Gln) amidotransferase subunit [Actinomycetota bacterium]
MRPAGSRAREAVAAARAHLADYRPDPVRRPPAVEYRPPAHDRSPSGPPRDPLAAAVFTPGSGPGPVAAAAADLRAGLVTSRQLVTDALLAVEKHDAELRAIVHLMDAEALSEADACDAEAAAGAWRGPLHGIPVTVKDIIDVAGAPTCAGSAAYREVPQVDAASVGRLRAAGAIILAKVSTHEFALGVTTPQSRNPHDLERIPGGSSGGSAIAVSVGMGLASLGTDTRASIRVPAALSGVVGFKPTYGSVPTAGVVPLSWTMDHVAPIAASVGDAALLIDVLAAGGRNLAGFAGADVAGLRVGVPEAAFADAEPMVAALVRRAVAALARDGCFVEESTRPTAGDLEAANAAGLIVSRCESAAFHRSLGTDRSLYWEEVADQLDAAAEVSAVEYVDAQRLRAELAERLLAGFDDHDVLAMPTVPVVAPLVADFARHLMLLSRNAIPWSFTGFPAMSVPCGWAGGLPVGLQLVAPPWREDLVIAVGSAVERWSAGSSPR